MDYPDKFDELGYCVLEEKLFDKDPDELLETLVEYVKWSLDCTRYDISPPSQLHYGCTILINLAIDEFWEEGVLRILKTKLDVEFESIDALRNSIAP